MWRSPFNFPNIIHNTAWSSKGLTSILTLTWCLQSRAPSGWSWGCLICFQPFFTVVSYAHAVLWFSLIDYLPRENAISCIKHGRCWQRAASKGLLISFPVLMECRVMCESKDLLSWFSHFIKRMDCQNVLLSRMKNIKWQVKLGTRSITLEILIYLLKHSVITWISL